MTKNNTINILERFLRNADEKFTEQEYKQLLRLIEEEDAGELTAWAREKWADSEARPYGNTQALNDIFARIKDRMHESANSRTEAPRRRFWAIAQRVAAVLFLPVLLLAGYLLWQSKPGPGEQLVAEIGRYTIGHPFTTSQEYRSPAGTRSKVILSDSTVVWLNSSSSLLVDQRYGTGCRRVSLSGQAYFEVKKNRQVPFVVDLAEQVNLTVTGTTFSVSAYAENKTIEAVLVSGTVFLNHFGETVQMEPSQKATVDKTTETLTLASVADESYKKWKDGVLIFNETPMPEVISTLERWFNVAIQVENSEINNYKFTAKLDNCSLEQVMTYLSLSSPLSYRIKERDVELKIKK